MSSQAWLHNVQGSMDNGVRPCLKEKQVTPSWCIPPTRFHLGLWSSVSKLCSLDVTTKSHAFLIEPGPSGKRQRLLSTHRMFQAYLYCCRRLALWWCGTPEWGTERGRSSHLSLRNRCLFSSIAWGHLLCRHLGRWEPCQAGGNRQARPACGAMWHCVLSHTDYLAWSKIANCNLNNTDNSSSSQFLKSYQSKASKFKGSPSQQKA